MVWVEYVAVFLVGIVLGSMYFGGLWCTVAAIANKRLSAWWLAISFLTRLMFLTVGLYFVLLVGVWHLVVCLVGIIAARLLLVRIVGQVGYVDRTHG